MNQITHNPFNGNEVRQPKEILKDIKGSIDVVFPTVSKMFELLYDANAHLTSYPEALNRDIGKWTTELLTELFISLQNHEL